MPLSQLPSRRLAPSLRAQSPSLVEADTQCRCLRHIRARPAKRRLRLTMHKAPPGRSFASCAAYIGLRSVADSNIPANRRLSIRTCARGCASNSEKLDCYRRRGLDLLGASPKPAYINFERAAASESSMRECVGVSLWVSATTAERRLSTTTCMPSASGAADQRDCLLEGYAPASGPGWCGLEATP